MTASRILRESGKLFYYFFRIQIMKLFSHIAMFAAGMLALASCSDESIGDIDVDDPFVQPGDRAATIEVPLRFHVEKPSLIGKPLVNDISSRLSLIHI